MLPAFLFAIFFIVSRQAAASSAQARRSRGLTIPSDAGTHCKCLECDIDAWNTAAIDSEGNHTCGARIEWVVVGTGVSQDDACLRVGAEFPEECAACDPSRCTLRESARCGCQQCEASWDAVADGHSCGSRITWLQTSSLAAEILTEDAACLKVGQDEFPGVCSGCDPDVCDSGQVSVLPTQSPVPRPPSPMPAGMQVTGMHCGCEECNFDVWHTPAIDSEGSHTCGSRIEWADFGTGLTQDQSCFRVASEEFPGECGACDPSTCTRRSTPRCGCEACEAAWDVLAGEYTCGSRITWLQTSKLAEVLFSEHDACMKVSRDEFPEECFACNPDYCVPSTSPTALLSPLSPQPIPPTHSTSSANPEGSACNFDGAGIIPCTRAQVDLMPPQHLSESLISTRPIPTNKWWTNMIGPDDNPSNFPIYAHPFQLTFNLFDDKDYGLHVCYSHDYRFLLDDYVNGVPKGYIHGSGSDLIFSAVDFTTEPDFAIVDWDDLGLGIRVEVRAENGGMMTTKLVEGMPFVTAQYTGLIPRITTIHAILSVNGESIDASTAASYTGSKFVVTLNKGQKWVIFASETITLETIVAIEEVAAYSLVASGIADDVTLRIALLPEGVDEGVYDLFSTCIVTGGSLEISNSSSYSILWSTEGDCSFGLLHMGFPHHEQVLDKRETMDAGVVLMSTTRGAMKAWKTPSGGVTRWTMNEVEDIPVNGFFPLRSPVPYLIETFDVLGILEAEIADDFVLDGFSYYYTGKSAQKYATMCLLATVETVNPAYPEDLSLVSSCTLKLQAAFDPFLRNQFAYPLVYDEIYFGISSSEGFSENGNVNSDFGNTVYNDHHFHYGVSTGIYIQNTSSRGSTTLAMDVLTLLSSSFVILQYWIVAGAILKKLDPSWSRIDELNFMIESLIRDTANTNISWDPLFPLFRNFDWFAGHSLSHGLVPFFDGKDQESTSEEMNFHYGLMLWGQVSNDSDLETLGEIMMKVGKRSVGQYLLMEDTNTVHPEIVPNKVVGIFFDNKVDYTTWFGAEREKIHGINMIPVSPVNEFLRTDTFVHEEWNSVLFDLELVKDPDNHRENTWQSLLFANYAVIDQVESMIQLSQAAMDPGLSRAWALYFAATRAPKAVV
jgi:endo-1,3(4)-beta-glucanase